VHPLLNSILLEQDNGQKSWLRCSLKNSGFIACDNAKNALAQGPVSDLFVTLPDIGFGWI